MRTRPRKKLIQRKNRHQNGSHPGTFASIATASSAASRPCPSPAATCRAWPSTAKPSSGWNTNRAAAARHHLMALEIGNEGKKPERILADVRSFELSANGQKILARKDDEFYVFDAAPSPPAKLAKSKVDLVPGTTRSTSAKTCTKCLSMPGGSIATTFTTATCTA